MVSYMNADCVVIGGGPGGLAAALALGRARKRVLLVDAGPRRTAAATNIHNFVTRDGTPPDAFRTVGREQLATYPNVDVQDVGVTSISGSRGAFRVELSSGTTVAARRVLLCTGMIDELLPLEGFRELWGRSIFQCPYCHGWEVRDRPWGYLVLPSSLPHFVPFALQARGWTSELTVFTQGAAVPADAIDQLRAAGIRIEPSPVSRLIASDAGLVAVALADGIEVPSEALFVHPPQRQVALVRDLGVALDEDGYVRTDPMKRETSIPGIYAAGDLASRMQGAIFAASSGTHAAAMLNLDLQLERATVGVG
jgi:thioredoxin reductase